MDEAGGGVRALMEMRVVAVQVCGSGGELPVRARPSARAAGWRRVAFLVRPPRDAPHTPHVASTSSPPSPHGAPSWRHERAAARRWAPVAPSSSRRPREGRAAPHPLTTCPLLITHAVQRPAVSGQAPPLHTVRRTWCSSTKHHHHGGGPASRATTQTHRDARGAIRRRDHERRRLPRAAAGRVLHTMCHTQRRNQRLADQPFRAPGRAEPRAKGGERDAPHPRPPAERTGPARAPRSAAQIPPIQALYRWAFRASRS